MDDTTGLGEAMERSAIRDRIRRLKDGRELARRLRMHDDLVIGLNTRAQVVEWIATASTLMCKAAKLLEEATP